MPCIDQGIQCTLRDAGGEGSPHLERSKQNTLITHSGCINTQGMLLGQPPTHSWSQRQSPRSGLCTQILNTCCINMPCYRALRGMDKVVPRHSVGAASLRIKTPQMKRSIKHESCHTVAPFPAPHTCSACLPLCPSFNIHAHMPCVTIPQPLKRPTMRHLAPPSPCAPPCTPRMIMITHDHKCQPSQSISKGVAASRHSVTRWQHFKKATAVASVTPHKMTRLQSHSYCSTAKAVAVELTEVACAQAR